MKRIASVLLVLVLALTLVPAARAAEVRPSSQKFTVNGREVSCAAFNIDGYNYLMLRGLAVPGAEAAASERTVADWAGKHLCARR